MTGEYRIGGTLLKLQDENTYEVVSVKRIQDLLAELQEFVLQPEIKNPVVITFSNSNYVHLNNIALPENWFRIVNKVVCFKEKFKYPNKRLKSRDYTIFFNDQYYTKMDKLTIYTDRKRYTIDNGEIIEEVVSMRLDLNKVIGIIRTKNNTPTLFGLYPQGSVEQDTAIEKEETIEHHVIATIKDEPEVPVEVIEEKPVEEVDTVIQEVEEHQQSTTEEDNTQLIYSSPNKVNESLGDFAANVTKPLVNKMLAKHNAIMMADGITLAEIIESNIVIPHTVCKRDSKIYLIKEIALIDKGNGIRYITGSENYPEFNYYLKGRRLYTKDEL